MPKAETRDPKERPFIDASEQNLLIDLCKVNLRLRGNGKTLRRLQKSVGEDKNLQNDLIAEIDHRMIDKHNIEIPFGFTMETLFGKDEADEEDEE
jgi:hypothetical protein